MIGYVTLGTGDIERAASFYDALLAELDIKRTFSLERFIAWGPDAKAPSLAICTPYDNEPATVGNGVMVALRVKTSEEVDKVYNKAIELGGSCEGPAGPRGTTGFYAGYFRDLDGNKLNVYCQK
jgi:predicted lactoylglutathione lyase